MGWKSWLRAWSGKEENWGRGVWVLKSEVTMRRILAPFGPYLPWRAAISSQRNFFVPL